MRESASLVSTLCACFALAVPAAKSAALSLGDQSPPDRVVAMGDVHGNFDALATMLKKTGLVDDSLHWSGANSIFVQLGDFTDRGSRVREVMDLLMRLQNEARRERGEVIVLMGNHEMMNIVGDYRYVASEAYRSFLDDESDRRRSNAFKDYLKWRKRRATLYGDVEEKDAAQLEAEWMEAHPPGAVEYVEAMGPKGTYGKWIRTLPTVAKLGDSIFLHGGIHPSLADLDLDELNKRVDKERAQYDTFRAYLVGQQVIEPHFNLGESFKAVKQQFALLSGKGAWAEVGSQTGSRAQMLRILVAYLKMGEWLSMSQDGPLWYRGYASLTDEEGPQAIQQILDAYQAKRFVVGHTIVDESRISIRFGERLVLIDTLEPAALIIEGDHLTEVYSEGSQPLVGWVSPRARSRSTHADGSSSLLRTRCFMMAQQNSGSVVK